MDKPRRVAPLPEPELSAAGELMEIQSSELAVMKADLAKLQARHRKLLEVVESEVIMTIAGETFCLICDTGLYPDGTCEERCIGEQLRRALESDNEADQ